MQTKRQGRSVQEAIEDILRAIIDGWYTNVSDYYVTTANITADPQSGKEVELKCFHDKEGHRIKFNKDELDFTYGLRSFWQHSHFVIEASVNNKIENFDYEELQKRLRSHYRRTGDQPVPTPYELRTFVYRDVFRLEPSFHKNFTVEQRKNRADIMRLSFRIDTRFLDRLVAHPMASKELIENYCVSPLRSVYARVYRQVSE